ncbi:MAG: spoIIGA [Symbiobacteriaceae bacterium]|nr:spoIIGA [Symbiobacteriaceae bacterium]
MVLVVSVDLLFLLNFLVDLVWLAVTARAAGLKAGRWRMTGAAMLGALLAVWAAFPGGRWLRSPPGAALGTCLVLAAAFAPCAVRQAWRALWSFLLSGAAIAGTVILIQLRLPGIGLYMPSTVAGGLVLAGLALGGAGVRYLWESLRERSQLKQGIWSLRILIEGQSVSLPALVDTGNHLRDPLTSMPVAVVEAAALGQVLPPAVTRAVAMGWEGLERLPGDWAARCRLVPFRAVGRPEGMLLAFLPDDLSVQPPGGGQWQTVPGLVGLSTASLHPEAVYRALLPLQLAPSEKESRE